MLPATSRPLAIGFVLATLVGGLLPPAFTIATGGLTGAVADAVRRGVHLGQSHRLVTALLVTSGLYVANLILGPVRETLGDVMMRRLDEHLVLRVMAAVSRPRGVAHVEDPLVLDRIAQSLGAVSGYTPGMAAYYFIQVWAQRLQASTSLAIVGAFRWWLAVLLLGAHVVSYYWRRWHWHEVTEVLHGSTDFLRRTHYLRNLAVTPPAAKEIRVFGLADWLVGRYRETFGEIMEEIWATRREGALIAVAVSGALLAVEGLALVLIVLAGVRGSIGLGAVVVFAQAVVAASNLGTFTEGHIYVEEGSVALDRLAELEEAVPAAVTDLEGDGPAAGLPTEAMQFDDVRFRYPGRDTDVFTGLNLTIEAGKSLAIVGDNGAGKTTLVKLLCRLYDPTDGRITVDGIDLRAIDARQWQARVAAIFQDFVQYQLSAHDNVAFGSLANIADRGAVIRAADLAGATPLVARWPKGWDTTLSRQFTDGADLSGGEWQRIALARALFAVAGGAGVLILDEPTAALDVRGESEIYERFLELTRGVTTIVISHRFSTVRRADRIVVLEAGRVVEEGTHDELVAARGKYASMYAVQAARFRDDAREVTAND